MALYLAPNSGPSLVQLRAGVRNKGYDGASDAQIDEAINAAYRDILTKKRWSWLEVNDTTLVTTPNDPDVSLTSVADLLHIDAVRLQFGSEYEDLAYLSPAELRSEQHEGGYSHAGWPMNWTLQANKLQLYPIPDRAYRVHLDYIKVPPAITTNVSAQIPAPYQDLIEWRAAMELSARQRDGGTYQAAGAMFTQRLGDLMRADGHRHRQQGNQVRSGFWERLPR